MIKNIESSWINVAINEAHKSNFKKKKSVFKLGAVIIKNGKIVGRGYNYKTNNIKFINYGCNQSIHAECLAIQRARRKGEIIIIVRILRDGTLTMAAPCKKCFEAIKKSGIKTIIYSDWNGEFQKMRL